MALYVAATLSATFYISADYSKRLATVQNRILDRVPPDSVPVDLFGFGPPLWLPKRPQCHSAMKTTAYYTNYVFRPLQPNVVEFWDLKVGEFVYVCSSKVNVSG